jgi:hypothetical protein
MIRYEIDDGMFPILNKTFPASDLLRQLWMFLASKTHANRTAILNYTEKWFVASLATADDFHSSIRQFSAIQALKNILNYHLPLDPASDFMLQLLQGIRRNVASVPDLIRTDFTTLFVSSATWLNSPKLSSLSQLSPLLLVPCTRILRLWVHRPSQRIIQ